MQPTQLSKGGLYYSIFKWLILVLSYGFLIYKIWNFDNYEEIRTEFVSLTFQHLCWLLFVLLLLPLNWSLEAFKWQYLCRSFEKFSFNTAIKSVLAGLTPGFLSPNRIGEIIGRPLFLKQENRVSGALMTLVSSFSQTITIVSCGIPSALFFFFYTAQSSLSSYKLYTYICMGWLILFLVVYMYLPRISGWLSKKSIAKRIQKELDVISGLSYKQLLVTLIYSLIRYIIFCLQLYFLLFFCGVYISPSEALLCITLNYLFVTITPSVSFSEAAVRASYAVFFIGFYSNNVIGIASAGILLWFINFIIPMLIGSIFFARTRYE